MRTTTFRTVITTAALASAVLGLAFAAPPAAAQVHTQESGDLVVRASTSSAANLPDKMRQEHGIPTDPNTAVLNVTVQRKSNGAMRNVPARLEVRARNLYGVETSVSMKETAINDFVSYMGTYSFLPREVLDFRVVAYPAGAAQPITLEFRDRLGRQ